MLTLCFCAFLCFGVVLVLVGANQASLAAALSLDLAESGLLASAVALGLGVGVVVAGPLFDRFPRRPLFVGSTLLAGLALIAVEPGMSYGRWLVHCALVGLGIGLYDTLINAVLVQRYELRAARPMLVIHSAATLGAMLGPPAIGWIARHGDFTDSFVAIGAAHLGLAGWAAWVPLPGPPPRGRSSRAALGAGWAPLALLACVAFAYVGVEASVTVFAIPYGGEALGLGTERAQLSISAFWLGLLAGRVGLLALPGHLGARVLLLAGAASAGLVAGNAAWPGAPLELFLLLIGFCLGSVYPLMIALTGQRFPAARGTAAGLAAGAGALGGFAIPWWTGAFGDAVGIAPAFASLALWCAAIAAAAGALRGVR